MCIYIAPLYMRSFGGMFRHLDRFLYNKERYIYVPKRIYAYMVYYTVLPTELDLADYEKICNDVIPFLPAFRKEKASGIIPVRERVVSALSFVLLCHGLLNEYPERFGVRDIASVGNLIQFSYGENGKPALCPPYGDIFFNMSHCRTAIACAVAPFEVGVDIQDIRRPSAAVLKRTGRDMNGVEFSAFWSRYEAYTKLTGKGISTGLADCDYISEAFLKGNNVSIETTPVFYPDFSCSPSDFVLSDSMQTCSVRSDNTQKKTAAFLSTAFYDNPNTNFNNIFCDFSRLCKPALL